MDNPFSPSYPDAVDDELVQLAMNGDRKALQNLVLRHQPFIYNLALKMTRNVADAEDLSQEVFIKAITSLAKFERKSKFRTWLYRIAVNHFINTTKKKQEFQVFDFETYFNSIDDIPDIQPNDIEKKELTDTIEEIRINCTAGMLLCLNREQRLVYILGEMFEIDHQIGAEILAISAGNFRIRLMRARADLYNWINKRCGLINHNNPCRCLKKTKAYIEAGAVNPQHLIFNRDYTMKIFELSKGKAAHISETFEDLNKQIYQTHPFNQSSTAAHIVDQIVNNDLIRSILRL